jgi:hypothetical protein
MEASLRSRAGAGQGGFALRPEQSGKYFRPARAPTGKNSGATRVQRPGKFFACDFLGGQNIRLVRFCREKFRSNSRLEPGRDCSGVGRVVVADTVSQ